MLVRVKCTYYLDVEIPDDCDPIFVIEENGCPCTGVVGLALNKLMDKHEESGTCWACDAQGNNEIVSQEDK